MKKLMMVMAAALLALGVRAASEVVDGVTWSYTVSDGKASVYKGLGSSGCKTNQTNLLTKGPNP